MPCRVMGPGLQPKTRVIKDESFVILGITAAILFHLLNLKLLCEVADIVNFKFFIHGALDLIFNKTKQLLMALFYSKLLLNLNFIYVFI